jgi:hypothetical protein
MCDAIAEGTGEPLSVVGKTDEEIVLPEVVKKDPEQSFVQHKRFSRGSFVRNDSTRSANKTTTVEK